MAKTIEPFNQTTVPPLDSGDFYYDYGWKDVTMANLQAKLGKSR
jgi:hypothetical protein